MRKVAGFQKGCDCNTLQHTAKHCNKLQYTAYTTTHYNTNTRNALLRVVQEKSIGPVRIGMPKMACFRNFAGVRLQHTATHCNTLQHTAMHCNALKRTETHCNMLQHTFAIGAGNFERSGEDWDAKNGCFQKGCDCSMLQHTATHYNNCNALKHTVTLYNTLQHTATHCNTLLRVMLEKWSGQVRIGMRKMDGFRTFVRMQHTVTHCNTLQYTEAHCNTLKHTATHCNTLYTKRREARTCTATHCNTLQHTATRCHTQKRHTCEFGVYNIISRDVVDKILSPPPPPFFFSPKGRPIPTGFFLTFFPPFFFPSFFSPSQLTQF